MIPTPLIGADRLSSLVGQAVFLDVRTGPAADSDFATARVPGAIRVDLEVDLSNPGDPAQGGRHPLPSIGQWLAKLGSWGIEPSTQVILYDAAAGGMAAARAWWMLRAVGHVPVAVVNGGWGAILDAGVSLDAGPVAVPAIGRPAYSTEVADWPAVDAAFVERVRHDPRWRVLDARAPRRFEGLEEPLDPVAGHIPGATNLHWQSLVDQQGRFLPPDELRRRFGVEDVRQDETQIVCSCGSGVTACHLLLAMEASGIRGGELYVGSWSEWCRIRPGASGTR